MDKHAKTNRPLRLAAFLTCVASRLLISPPVCAAQAASSNRVLVTAGDLPARSVHAGEIAPPER